MRTFILDSCLRIFPFPALDNMLSRTSIPWACIGNLFWAVSNYQSSFSVFWMFWLQAFSHFLYSLQLVIILCPTSFVELRFLQRVIVLWLDSAFCERVKWVRMNLTFFRMSDGKLILELWTLEVWLCDRELSQHYSCCFWEDGVSKGHNFSAINEILVISRIF